MRPGQPLPSICTSSHCLPAALSSHLLPVLSLLTQPGVPHRVPASGQLSPLLPGRGTIRVHHYIPSAGLVAAGSPAPAPAFPQQTGAFPSPRQGMCHPARQLRRARSWQTALLKSMLHGGGTGWTCCEEIPTQPTFPVGCSTAEMSLGAECREPLGRGTAWRRAATTQTRGCCAVTNPIQQLPPAAAVQAGPCGTATLLLPAQLREVAATSQVSPGQPVPTSTTLHPGQPGFWGQQPQHRLPTQQSHHCLPPQVPFPMPQHPLPVQAGTTPQRPLMGCRAGPGSPQLLQVSTQREGATHVLGSGRESPPVPLSEPLVAAGRRLLHPAGVRVLQWGLGLVLEA
ncbi:uncharacterized protein LOC129736874 [Falco cherrug]|uniref:uncharacterized protein LOC129736874 n=1 Tax=Falco cherrug TaxID=345164 RepID=UPI00247A0D32|nr:uncharacterized protein LOC129736874 [Falco cherrug]